MKKLILVIMILMVFLTAGVIPQVVYGEDEEEDEEEVDLYATENTRLLTPEEQAFRWEFQRQWGELHSLSTHFGRVARRDYRSAQDIAEEWEFVNRFNGYAPGGWPGCGIQSSPPIYDSVRRQLNKLCPDWKSTGSKIYSYLEEAMEDPEGALTSNEWQDRMRAAGHECLIINDGVFDVREMCDQLTKDLIRKRREVREEAKPLLEAVKDELKKKEAEDRSTSAEPDEDINSNDSANSDEFCFIATAAYGTLEAEEIDTLRQFRDEFLVHNYPGRAFVAVYYATSPPVAGFISEHEMLRVAVREGFVAPIVTVLELTESWWAE